MAILLPDRGDVATFGAFLRGARERRGLSIQQIAHETRIPWRHLDALEHGNLDAVPAGMYRRAEIRAYADAVGLDRAVALSQLEHALEKSVAPDSNPEPSPRTGRTHLAWTAAGALGVVAAATMFAVSLWRVPTERAVASPPLPAPSAAVAESAPRPPAPTPEQPAAVSTVTPAIVAAAVAAADVVLAIESDPPGARVLVDGIGRGATPITIGNLAPGAIRVRVIKDGFVSQERLVQVGSPGNASTLRVTLNAVH